MLKTKYRLQKKNYNSHLQETNILKSIKPSMRYNSDMPFEDWQSKARTKLFELLGLPLEYCESKFEIEYTKEHDTYTEYRFSVQTEPEYFVPCHLLKPKNIFDPVPLTVCLSGHGGGMHVALGVSKTEEDKKALEGWHHRAMGLRSIKEGRCALVIEARNFGESSLEGYGTSCTEAGKIALLIGRTILGERVWDAMRILDAVGENFPFLDMSDIVCTGNSGGGTATYYLACLDERISIAAPSCSVCEFENSIAAMSHCMCNYVPNIRKYFEMGDMAGMIAPRPLIIAAGEKDRIFPIDGTYRSFNMAKYLYTISGASEKCALVIGEGGHLNYADLIWKKIYEIKGISK